ncbi:MAG: hypothetical protein SVP52_09010 [Chloroflexota bacterium]|nr:hypothetical protein [Chloroflexota bacterium]
MVNDISGIPVWWGYVQEIIIYLDNTKITISLDNLFNSVSVRYSFISPNAGLSDMLMTPIASDLSSQAAFGTKEIMLQRIGIDDDFALSLRDTFLNSAALPQSILSQNRTSKNDRVILKCSGWFKTLAWKYYQSEEGFYANTGSGPGVYNFANSSLRRYPSQLFTPGDTVFLKYAYFQLRKVGSPTRNLNAQLRSESGSLLATSDPVSGSTLSPTSYRWVRFLFSDPEILTVDETYMIGVTGNSVNGSHYFSIKSDENQSFQDGYAKYYNGSSWFNLPSITNPGGLPDLIFRVVGFKDTGDQISSIAIAGDQFFTRIESLASHVYTCPYLDYGDDCLTELKNIMALGTSNHRRILAHVSPKRELQFYEQPDPDIPTVYMNAKGQFVTFQGTLLKPYFPPVGQFAQYSGSARVLLPFDKLRLPACFIEGATYYPQTGSVKIYSF